MAAAEKLFHGLKLISLCGSGAYGEVWYCEDISGRRLALKIVAKNRLGDAWKRELQGVINYHRITENSPYLLHIFHVDEDETHFYYTMEAADSADAAEYVPDTLARRLQNGPLPPRQLFPVLAGVFNGLAAIHQAGFAHRDIKPDNIIFVGGVPKLSDIGLVSALSNSMTRLAGTLEFLPPEERTGDTESTDRASRQRNDLYAFGKVVYCAATGLEPGQYPSLPSRVGLSTELKLFLRLAFKLCARESQLRTDDLQSLDAELKLIERQLATGETAADKLRYAVWKLHNRFLSEMLALTRALRKTGWILILLVLLAAALGVWQWRKYRKEIESLKRPEKPTAPEIAPKPTVKAPKFKPYVLESLGLRMSIPSSWQAMSEEHIRAQVDEMTKELNETTKDENAKKLLRHAIGKAKTWKGMIRCDLYDVIEISRTTPPAAQLDNLWTMPENDLKRAIRGESRDLEGNPEFYELKRIMFAGRRCVVIDFTVDRHDRYREYIFLDDRGMTTIALTGDAATFARRAKEFDAMLKTLEFDGPAPKYASPPKPAPTPTEPTPTEPTPPKPAGEILQTVTDPRGRFTIRIPASWQVLPEERVRQLVDHKSAQAKKRAPSPVERMQLQALSLMVENRGTLIHCNFDDPAWHDDVEITPEIKSRKAEIWSLSDAELRRKLLAEASGAGNTDLVVYRVEHTEVADRSAIMLEFSSNPRHDRSLGCLVFTDDDSALQIVLSARNDKFSQLRPEFEKALKTLKLPPPRPGAAKTDAKTAQPPKTTGKTKTAASTSVDTSRKKRNTRRTYPQSRRRKRTNTTGKTAKSKEAKKSMLEWMILECPAYRELAEERKKELEELEAQQKAGKFYISNDASRLKEEELWRQLEAAYQEGRNTPVDTGFHIAVRQIKLIRANRKKFEAHIAASGKQTGKKPVMTELATDIGWENYQMLMESPRYGKIVMAHEAEVAAEKERRKNGAPEPEPDSESILEEKLWKALKRAFTMQHMLVILDHIEYVRSHRGKDNNVTPVPPKGSKKLINEKLKAYLYIPREWIIAFPEGRDPSDTEDDDFSPEQLGVTQKRIYDRTNMLRRFAHARRDETLLVYCDKDKKWRDTVFMRRIDIPSGNVLYRVRLNDNDKRIKLAGRCCVITKDADDSVDDELRLFDIRHGSFCIDDGNTCICFNLYAKRATFDKRMQELEAAIKTLKFTK